jgi:hypothetical protein
MILKTKKEGFGLPGIIGLWGLLVCVPVFAQTDAAPEQEAAEAEKAGEAEEGGAQKKAEKKPEKSEEESGKRAKGKEADNDSEKEEGAGEKLKGPGQDAENAEVPDESEKQPEPQPTAFEKEGEQGPALDLEGLPEDVLNPAADPSLGPSSSEGTSDVAETSVDAGQKYDKRQSIVQRVTSILNRTVVGGYGEHDFVTGEGEISGFRNHRYVIFVYSQIHDRISTSTEIEFEWAGSPLKRDGTFWPGEVLLEFSVLDFRVVDALNLRAGVILVPVGTFNVRHDAPTRELADRPIAYTTIVPSTWFESGAGAFGTIPFLDSHEVNYEIYVVNGLDAQIRDGLGYRAARGSHFEDNNLDKAVVGRLAYSPALGNEIGFSAYSGAYDHQGRRANLLNLDGGLTWGPFEVLGETVLGFNDAGYVEGFPAGSTANTRDAIPTRMWGFYLQGNWHFQIAPLWRLLPENLQDAAFTLALRYEGKDTDLAYHSAQGDQRRLTLGLNFRPIQQVVWKLDLQENAYGVDGQRAPAEVWQPDFWTSGQIRFVSSVAYLF